MAKKDDTAVARTDLGSYQTVPFDIRPFVRQAVREGRGGGRVIDLIIASPAFHAAYPGIFRSNGTLKMAPSEYDARADAYRAAAASGGYAITPARIGSLIARDTSPDEFAFRVKFTQQVKANRDVLDAFNQQLKAVGQRPITTAQQAFDFVNSKSNPVVYRLYESATTQAAAESAGIEITPTRARALAAASPEVLSFDESLNKFAQIAKEREFASAELRAFGLSEQDLQTIEFGGPDQAQLAALREKAVRQRAVQGQIAPSALPVKRSRKGLAVTGQEQAPGL